MAQGSIGSERSTVARKSQWRVHRRVGSRSADHLTPFTVHSQAVQDETASLNLELSQLDQKCENLQTDNAELLSRWIEAKQEMADAVNEMNDLANQNKLAKLESQLKQATVHGEDGHTVQGGSDGKGASEQGAPPGEG